LIFKPYGLTFHVERYNLWFMPRKDLVDKLGLAAFVKADLDGIPRRITPGDIAWAAQAMAVRDAKKEDAPSPFAWTLRQFAMRNAECWTFFMTKVLPLSLPSRAGQNQGAMETFEDDGRRIDEFISTLVKAHGADPGSGEHSEVASGPVEAASDLGPKPY
jgi:hypothetical protein